jgi:hypothetical protein
VNVYKIFQGPRGPEDSNRESASHRISQSNPFAPLELHVKKYLCTRRPLNQRPFTLQALARQDNNNPQLSVIGRTIPAGHEAPNLNFLFTEQNKRFPSNIALPGRSKFK